MSGIDHCTQELSMRKTQPSKLTVLTFAIAAAIALASPLAFAQYPTKPVTIIVPWPAADPVTTAVRGVAEIVATELKQPVVVNNIVGAGGQDRHGGRRARKAGRLHDSQ
jgi:tripartite-type tricarboxylate transporter receptor subunit TctC